MANAMQTIVLISATLLLAVPSFGVSTKIAFGSCFFPGLKGIIFKEIASRNPDLFIWNGDVTYIDYADWDPRSGYDSLRTMFIEQTAAPLSEWPSLYDQTKNNPNYQLLLDTNASITGTYDDHDYGQNGAFGEFEHKDYSQGVFLDFFDVPETDPIRAQEGIYNHIAYEVRMEEQNVTKIIDIILLDIHYFAKIQESKEDILGPTQWSWLYNVVQNETHGELLLIVSGLEILPVGRDNEETWGTQFAESQREMFDLLLKYNTNKRVLFLTGDLHRGETLQTQCINQKTGRKQNFYEISSSALTHGDGDVTSYLLRNKVVMDDFLMYDGTVMCRYKPRNFGQINVEWEWNADRNDAEIVSVYASLVDINGKDQCSIDVPLWTDNADLDYEVDDSKFVAQTFGDYQCYGAKKQHTMKESTSRVFHHDWMWLIIFGQMIFFVLFYSTTFVVAVVKCCKPTSKCVKWCNNK
eukprot:31944_1